jgi:hypothetical protein
MNRALFLARIAATGPVAAGCGGASHPSNPVEAPVVTFSCLPDGLPPPPSKLITHPSGGVSGRWIVVLNDKTAPVHTAAAALASRYGGEVLAEWDALGMFLISMDESAAATLSEDPAVCFVEQDAIAHGT